MFLRLKKPSDMQTQHKKANCHKYRQRSKKYAKLKTVARS